MNSKIHTFTGGWFDPLNPDPRDVRLEDIAHALALTCRYNGHVRKFYSVAEHCVRATVGVHSSDKLWVLFHDAAEAYIADLVAPIKQYIEQYQAIEEGILEVVGEAFGLGPFPSAVVKLADLRMFATERRDFFSLLNEPWAEGIAPGEDKIIPWSWQKAEKRFLNTALNLFAERGEAKIIDVALNLFGEIKCKM